MAAFDTASVLSDFAFFEPLRVRWAEMDMQGVVFNPNYLMLRIGARIEQFGRTSFQPRVAVFREEELLADIGLTYVCVAPDGTRMTVPVPDAFVRACRTMDERAGTA